MNLLHYKRLVKYFGQDEYGYVDLPPRFSNVRMSRIFVGNEMGCSFCFPHGIETINARNTKLQRNWKKQRKHQWK